MKAIILCGGWDGHDPELVSARFAGVLQREGFQVDIVKSFKDFVGYSLADYDLIVPVWTQSEESEYKKKAVQQISRAVHEKGVGLAGCHGGIIDAFRMDTDWQYMTGAQWVYHGAQREYTVHYEGENIFTKGLKEFSLFSEQYYIHVDPAMQVYAYSEYPNGDEFTYGNGRYRMPVIMTKNFGQGRVFVFTVGHQDREFDIPEAQEIMRRGLLWAAKYDGYEAVNSKTLAAAAEAPKYATVSTPRTKGVLNVAVIGCGNISDIYFTNLTTRYANLNVVGCCDLIEERAKNAQQKYKIPKIYPTDIDACSDPDVDIILNITYPQAHFDVCKKALSHGKHVYVEKPLSLELEDGRELLRLAEEKNLYLGGAPDTFLGVGIQTAVEVIGRGMIGDPVAACANLACPGHESWHPNPDFYYKRGGGPLLDMGPYYITSLVTLLGGVESVIGKGNISFPTRTITSLPNRGQQIEVETPTHICAVLKFKSGALATLVTSFDVQSHHLPIIEIYGSRGTMCVPDPNCFGGDVMVKAKDAKLSIIDKLRACRKGGYLRVPNVAGYSDNSRGLGLSEMADSILSGREARASVRLTLHVLETMLGILDSAESGHEYVMTTDYTLKK